VLCGVGVGTGVGRGTGTEMTMVGTGAPLTDDGWLGRSSVIVWQAGDRPTRTAVATRTRRFIQTPPGELETR
jgi:hypothetical protein